MNDLGGHALYLSSRTSSSDAARRSRDTARVLSRYVDAIVYRAFQHQDMVDLAHGGDGPGDQRPRRSGASVPDRRRPPDPPRAVGRQLRRTHARVHRGRQQRPATRSCSGAALVGLDLAAAIPESYRPPADAWLASRRQALARDSVSHRRSPAGEAATEADALYTDVWVSMGDEAQKEARGARRSTATRSTTRSSRSRTRGLGPPRPPGPSRAGDHRRGDGRAAGRDLGPGGEPPPRPEGDPGAPSPGRRSG